MRNKQLLHVLIAIVLVLPSLLIPASNQQVSAAEDDTENAGNYESKDEVVYATLNPAGKRKEVYVVNVFDVVKEGKITDYGSYSNLKNLTDLSEIKQKKDSVEFTASEGKFYYQGDKNEAELPWDITISYYLDGKQIKPDELLGKDGKIEIKIHTTDNKKVDKGFFENYMLQLSLNLNTDIFKNIETEKGMVANAGKNKQVTFTVMPEKEGNLSVKADAADFEMQAMEIAAVPQAMSIESPDMDEMTSEMKSLTDAIKKTSDGVGELNNGVSELNSGVAQLRDGSKQYQNGIAEIKGSSNGLVNASVSIKEGLTAMSNSLNKNTGGMDLSALQELPAGLSQLATGMHQTADGLDQLNKNYTAAYSSLNGAVMAIPDYEITEKEIQALYQSGADKEVVDQLVETYSAARTAKGTYSKVKEAFAAVEPTLNEVSGSVTEMASTLDSMSAEISSSLEEMNGAGSIEELQKGLAKLSENYKDFHAGLVSYTDGVGQLSSSYKDIHAGIKELAGGTSELETGVNELDKGTDKLYQSTKDMPEEMKKEVDQMIEEFDKSDFDPVSFVSEKNEKVNSVQFVIKTESIEKQEQDAKEEPKEEEQQGFWDRLAALFKGL